MRVQCITYSIVLAQGNYLQCLHLRVQNSQRVAMRRFSISLYLPSDKVEWRITAQKRHPSPPNPSIPHLMKAFVVDAEIVADLVNDGFADLLDNFLARAEAAFVRALEYRDHIGDIAVVVPIPLG